MPRATDAQLLRLFERQAEQIERMDAATQRRMLQIYDLAGRELAQVLAQMEAVGTDEATPFTYAQYRSTMAQLEAGLDQLRRRLGEELQDGSRAQGEQGIEDILTVLGRAEEDFAGVAQPIEARSLDRLSQVDSLLLHKHSLDRYTLTTVNDIQQALLVGLARKETLFQLRKRIFGTGGRNEYETTWLRNRARVQLIVRMETARSSDEVHRATLEEAAKVLDVEGDEDPLLARADEFRDQRNHPLSPALHGQLRPLDGDWHVPRAEVETWQAFCKYKGPPSSIAWPLLGAEYVGRTYPAHFGDRGRQTPWRRSWGDSGTWSPGPAPGRRKP